jgi:hypothetical protein
MPARYRWRAQAGRMKADDAKRPKEEIHPVRPVQLRAARLLPLQDGELMAQDQGLCGLPCLLTPGEPQPRS